MLSGLSTACSSDGESDEAGQQVLLHSVWSQTARRPLDHRQEPRTRRGKDPPLLLPRRGVLQDTERNVMNIERRLYRHFYPDTSVPRCGWWMRLVQRRWSIIRPSGRVGRIISIRPHYSGFSVTVNSKWSWSILGPMSAWYYHTKPIRLKPLDITLDFGCD